MIEEQGPQWNVCTNDGVVYMRMYGALSREAVDATRRMQLAALKQRPEGIGILIDVGASPSLPSAELRNYAAQMAAKYPEGILGHATILRGDGFLASAARSAMTGIFMVARSPYPRTVVSTPEEAVSFLRERLGESAPKEQTMLRAFRSLPEPV